MRLLRTIALKADEAGLQFLIIGGYAVMAHGFVRATDDLDLLAQAGQRNEWPRLLQGMGMTVYRDGPTFLQFHPAPGDRLPVDVMFVTDDVFSRLQAGAERRSVGTVPVGVVSLHHLIALKCHAIRNAENKRGNLRIVKDTDDLIHLVKLNSVDLNAPEIRAIILRHGTDELYQKLQRTCAPD